jgi:hypothetical protein
MGAHGRIVILPSPLLPTLAYADLAEALMRAGAEVSIARADLGLGEGAAELANRWAGELEQGSLIVAHSNAGYLAPLVREKAGSHQGIVFMDAALPPESGTFTLAPARFRELLGRLADGAGMLPAWTRWWPREQLADVIPDEQFDEIDRACPRLSLPYFDAQLSAPTDWTAGPNAYLAFGATYADELAFARRRLWPSATLTGSHLAFVGSPDEVAAALFDLVEQLPRGT